MSEEQFSIQAPEGHLVYGVFHRTERASSWAVILIHGLTGDMGSYSQLSAARYLMHNNFPVFRFNQYEDLPKARPFHDTTIRGHVADTKLVMKYAQTRGFTNMVLVGHSLGAVIAISAADEHVKGLVLWDPSGAPAERIVEWGSRDERRGISYLDWRTRVILGEAWIEDARTFPDPFKTLSQAQIPTKIIAGEHGGVLRHCERYLKAKPADMEMVVIPGSGHTFLEEGAIDALNRETHTFLDKLR